MAVPPPRNRHIAHGTPAGKDGGRFSSPTLTVYCKGGLANRIRLLVSGLAIAEATGRRFSMQWPRTRHCAAAFRELFSNDWPVLDVDALDPSWKEHSRDKWSQAAGYQLLTDSRPHIILGQHSWLIRPEDLSVPLVARRCAAFLAELAPLPPLSRRIADFKADHFQPTMIGVHLRRGDFVRARPNVAGNTKEAMAVVDRMLQVVPEAGILLCSDDGALDVHVPQATRREGVQEAFESRYGARVVATTPRSLDRRTVEAVQDALVDLWLLRQTTMVVGTTGSSFSDFAVAARQAPHVFVSGAVPAFRPFALLARIPKVRSLVLRHFLSVSHRRYRRAKRP